MAASDKRSMREILSGVVVFSLSRAARFVHHIALQVSFGVAGALCAYGAMWFVVVRVPPVCCASVWLRTCTACIIMVAGPRVVGSALYMYRSHFGSRYKLGCCGHAGLFVAPCVAVVLLRLFGLVLRFAGWRCRAAGARQPAWVL